MDRNRKLFLVGSAALITGLSLSLAWQVWRERQFEREFELPPMALTSTRELWAAKARATPLPAELSGPAAYLEQRWGHMGAPALALTGVDANGQTYYISPQSFAGQNGAGEPVGAVALLRPQAFAGPTLSSGQPAGVQGGAFYGKPGAPLERPPSAPPK